MNRSASKISGIASAVAAQVFLALVLLAQMPVARGEETYQERMARQDREAQSKRDLDEYMRRWRENREACQYSAIAYSESTERWGYAWGKGSQGDAEREAMRRCNAADAKPLCWAKGGWYCALADGPKSYGAASAATAEEAKANALKLAGEVAPGSRIVLCFGGDPIKVVRTD